MKTLSYILSVLVLFGIAWIIFVPTNKQVDVPLSLIQEKKIEKHEILRVIDGDTLVISTPYLPPPLKKELSLRINGVDTPEKGFRAKCDKEKKLSIAAKQFTETQIKNAGKLLVVIEGWGKYGGRILGDVIIYNCPLAENGNNICPTLLSKLLIDNGYAVEYTGSGPKKDWCKEE
jgi:endonuclease YncB( thermonuclease family)